MKKEKTIIMIIIIVILIITMSDIYRCHRDKKEIVAYSNIYSVFEYLETDDKSSYFFLPNIKYKVKYSKIREKEDYEDKVSYFLLNKSAERDIIFSYSPQIFPEKALSREARSGTFKPLNYSGSKTEKTRFNINWETRYISFDKELDYNEVKEVIGDKAKLVWCLVNTFNSGKMDDISIGSSPAVLDVIEDKSQLERVCYGFKTVGENLEETDYYYELFKSTLKKSYRKSNNKGLELNRVKKICENGDNVKVVGAIVKTDEKGIEDLLENPNIIFID